MAHASAWPGLQTPETGRGWAERVGKPCPGAMALGGGYGGVAVEGLLKASRSPGTVNKGTAISSVVQIGG